MYNIESKFSVRKFLEMIISAIQQATKLAWNNKVFFYNNQQKYTKGRYKSTFHSQKPQAKIKYIGINLCKEVNVLGKKDITEEAKSLYNKYFEKI